MIPSPKGLTTQGESMELTMSQKQALTDKIANRYRKSTKQEKQKVLDEFVENTGYHRKYAIYLLTHWGTYTTVTLAGKRVRVVAGNASPGCVKETRGRAKRYTARVLASLILIWKFFDYRCGKLLAPLLRKNMRVIASYPKFQVTKEVQEKLMSISPATIDRLLKPERKKLQIKGRSHTKAGLLLKHQIPIRVYFDWDERVPGFFELDTVAHDGGYASGEYCFTLNATDISSGWIELRPLRNKAQRWVKESVEGIYFELPYLLRGIDSDNGGEFINKQLLSWCIDHSVTFTRGRPYKKNDNCFVEQKNGDIVRRYIGYYRFDTEEEYEALKTVYAVLCPLINNFYPSQKIISKTRVGAKVVKTYDAPKTPCERIMEALPADDNSTRELLTQQAAQYDLIELKIQLDAACETLMQRYYAKLDQQKAVL